MLYDSEHRSAELQRSLNARNRAEPAYQDDPCIHDLFEAQAARTPEAPALALGDATLSYGELNRRANRLARVLRERGVGPETPVGIFTSRSFDTLVSIFGVLKAGGAYLALDPVYPADRIAFMIEDSRTPVILTHTNLADRLPTTDAATLPVDVLRGETRDDAEMNPRFPVTPDNLAYLIYTSGSTGKPKGVLVTHRNLVHSTRARDVYYAEAVSSFLLLSSFAFDSSVAGIYWTLCEGGTLVIADEALQRDPTGIVEAIHYHGVSHLLTVPSLYALILDGLQTSGPYPLRTVIVAGETCPKGLIQRHLAALPDTAIYNEYGPTEATVWCTVFDCRNPIPGTLVPIGQPIIDTQLYVLDEGAQPVPAGSPGELYVGGKGVAQGYLNQPDLTAEKFVPDPFRPSEPRRLYRTGDLARILPDGTMEFLGRIDQQVKIRGFRVELGEIESALRAHREIRDAIVTTHETAAGNTRLVAHVLPRRKPWPSSQELLVFLGRELPAHMVPSSVILLNAFPLLPNGKVDRNALPKPGGDRPLLQHPYVPPRNGVEERLVSIWSEVLAVEMVGIEDDFIELGGDSLLSMQIVARARQESLFLSAEHMALHGTIAKLSSHVRTGNSVLAVEQGRVTGSVPLTPRQRKYFEEDHDTGGWIEQTALDLLEALDPARLDEAMLEVVHHHDALRMRFSHEDGRWQQRCLPEERHTLVSGIEAAQVRGHEWQAAVARGRDGALSKIDVMNGPLLQLAYLRRLRKSSRLFIFLHHLVVDAYSIPILLEDLETACRAVAHGNAPALPAKTTSYKVWAEHLAEWAGSEALRSQAEYWHGQGGTAEIQADIPGSADHTGFLHYVIVEMTAEETAVIMHDMPRVYGVHINAILLTALVFGLSWKTGSRSLLVDLSAHGREPIFDDVDVSRTVGWFASAFPVALDLEAATTPVEALELVRNHLQRVPTGGIGYGVLRYMGCDQEVGQRLRQLPQPVVGLNYQGRGDYVSSGSQLFVLRKKLSRQPPRIPVARSARLPVSGHIHEGKLCLRIRYHEDVYRRETVERFGAETVDALRSMVVRCRTTMGVTGAGTR